MRGTIRAAFAVGLMLVLAACAQAVAIDWVIVGDAPNAPDDTTYGAVAYAYRIGKYEITYGQYREFLNAKAAVGNPYGLYNTSMAGSSGGISRSGSGTVADPYTYSAKGGDTNWDSRPVQFVSFWDAARFANWMQNGQGSGDTETGAYTGIGDQATFARQPGALYFIPTEDEWYKAAYYDANKFSPGGPGYWEYPTMSDTAPTSEAPPGGANSANFWDYGDAVGSPYWTNEVGAYLDSASAYGTFDQGGNLWEWNETVIYTGYRGLRGGGWLSDAYYLSASDRLYELPSHEYGYLITFRLAGSAIPEPATLSLLGLGLAALLRRRRRRA